MRGWKPDDSDGNFNLTSMIDVVFLLVSFFMTVTSFASAELIEMEIPMAPEAKVPENSQGRQFVSIEKDGTYYLGAKKSNLDEIKTAIANRANDADFKGVYLRADRATPHKYINDLMEKCAEVGAYTIIFATTQD